MSEITFALCMFGFLFIPAMGWAGAAWLEKRQSAREAAKFNARYNKLPKRIKE